MNLCARCGRHAESQALGAIAPNPRVPTSLSWIA